MNPLSLSVLTATDRVASRASCHNV